MGTSVSSTEIRVSLKYALLGVGLLRVCIVWDASKLGVAAVLYENV